MDLRRKDLRRKYHEADPTTLIYRIDPPRRLRRAILLNDLTLVKRIVRTNPSYLVNPDYEDKSNTSLHLAARCGFMSIAEFLIEQGHEEEFVSRNTEWETPLMVAAANGKEDMGVMLAKRFPECVGMQNKGGLDALMLSFTSRHPTNHLLTTLLSLSPSLITLHDASGNTALHHASAFGSLKALRILLQYGADPMAQNIYAWSPLHYSSSRDAETYFKGLIIEFEKLKVERERERVGRERERERERVRNVGGVRLVTSDDASTSSTNTSTAAIYSSSQRPSLEQGRSSNTQRPSLEQGRGGSGQRPSLEGRQQRPSLEGRQRPSLEGRQRARDDASTAGLPAPGLDWSPVERRRAMTPTEGRSGWGFTVQDGRPRAGSGE